MSAAIGYLSRFVREVRWRWYGWSVASDRQFHDALYSGAAYDPFTFAYPGYLTIRRFADLAEPAITAEVHRVVDLGCGPAEITCELARRHPAIEFAGIDHSEAAIARARANAARLQLANIRFEAADVIAAAGSADADLVTMFDAFHHVQDPAAFVDRVRPRCERFFLIEPAGTWAGGWHRDVEFDWLARDLDSVRLHLEYLLEVTPSPSTAAGAAPEPGGRAVERRYTLADFERFFRGLGVSVRGTVAGLDRYPPDPYSRSAVRERFGRFAYELLREIDEQLLAADRDLAARHWAITVAPGARGDLGERAARWEMRRQTPGPLRGAYDASYAWVEMPPASLRAGQQVLLPIRIANRGWMTWSSDGATPIFASYHWLDERRAPVTEGERTPLPRPLEPDQTLDAMVAVRAPDMAGRYVLAVELVRETVTWFGAAGVPPLERRIIVS